MTDIFRKITAAEYRATLKLENLMFINGRAVNSEDELCAACVDWWDSVFSNKFDLIHIPNERKCSQSKGKVLKKMGVRAGVPDYAVFKDGAFIGWLEFKFGKNNLSTEQINFRDYCKKNNVNWAEIRSFEDFKNTLQRWGIYNPKLDKPKVFDFNKLRRDGKVLDINKIFKK